MKVKIDDVFHVRCDWESGGLSEGVIRILERPHGKVKFEVIKSIHRLTLGAIGVNDMYSFFSGRIWTSTKILKKDHPEYWL